MRTTRKLSEATKRKISESLKGNRNPNFGHPLNPTHRNNIRIGMLNYWKKIKN
jgi:hypothetical protein